MVTLEPRFFLNMEPENAYFGTQLGNSLQFRQKPGFFTTLHGLMLCYHTLFCLIKRPQKRITAMNQQNAIKIDIHYSDINTTLAFLPIEAAPNFETAKNRFLRETLLALAAITSLMDAFDYGEAEPEHIKLLSTIIGTIHDQLLDIQSHYRDSPSISSNFKSLLERLHEIIDRLKLNADILLLYRSRNYEKPENVVRTIYRLRENAIFRLTPDN